MSGDKNKLTGKITLDKLNLGSGNKLQNLLSEHSSELNINAKNHLTEDNVQFTQQRIDDFRPAQSQPAVNTTTQFNSSNYNFTKATNNSEQATKTNHIQSNASSVRHSDNLLKQKQLETATNSTINNNNNSSPTQSSNHQSQFRRNTFNFTNNESINAPVKQSINNVSNSTNIKTKNNSNIFNNKPQRSYQDNKQHINPTPLINTANQSKFTDYKKKHSAQSNVASKKHHSHPGKSADSYKMKMLTSFGNVELTENTGEILGNVLNVKLATMPIFHDINKNKIARTGNSSVTTNKNVRHIREVIITDNQIAIDDFANQIAVKKHFLMQRLRSHGVSVHNGIIDGDVAQLVAEELGHQVTRQGARDAEKNFLSAVVKSGKKLQTRPPVVTIMGHVDHGKTSLLDTIRKTTVTAGEAGGITQHIGAYKVTINDKQITFIDTPGHAAFTEMRARGAKVTDIVVLVVAADDGIMPQTIEAINHAKAANVTLMVAINKIDKPEANVEKTKQALMGYNLIPEELGGDTIMIPISAAKGTNINKLLEAILLQAEMLQLEAFYDGTTFGTVIESKMDKKRGNLATLIVQSGTLNTGNIIVIDSVFGRIRSMNDENGLIIKTATPSTPVEITGIDAIPAAGSTFYVIDNEKQAAELISFHKEQLKIKEQADNTVNKNDFLNILSGKGAAKKKINIFIKADTHGSLEAILAMLSKIEASEVELCILHSSVGNVNESDILLAKASHAIVIGFGGKNIGKNIIELAEKNSVELKSFDIIYKLLDDVKHIMSNALKPKIEIVIDGHAEIRAVFDLSSGKIAGCIVKSGLIKRSSMAKVIRNKQVVAECIISTLKKQKEDAKEVSLGHECGIKFDTYKDFQVGDTIETYHTIEKKQYL